MKRDYDITMVQADNLRPHPKNPRKDLGDLTELTESIRQNGIMQNLTAVPDPEKEDGYMIIIGHRRFAAGKAAGLVEFPVTIRDIDEQAQIRLMLCENIQRNDLTVIEQAAGFQMMIDFGISVDELAQDTGFAPSTIYHRLNIAKLNQKELEKKMDQLTISDLIELEKIDSVKERDKIIKESSSRDQVRQKASWAYRRQEQTKIAKKIRKMLKATDLIEQKATQWDSKVDECERLYIDTDTKPEEVKLIKKDGKRTIEFTHWYISDDNTSVLTYTLTKNKKKEKPTEKELKLKEIEKEISAQYKAINDEAHDIVEQLKVFIDTMPRQDEAAADMFIAETFMYMAIEHPSFYNMDAFDSDKLGVESEWRRPRSNNGATAHEEYAADMRAALLEKIGPRSYVWAATILAELAETESKRITHSCSEYYWTHDDVLNHDNAYRMNMIVTIFGYIGLEIEDSQKRILKGEGEPFDRIKELADKYVDLKG